MPKKFEHLEGVNGESVGRPVMFSITKMQKSSILQIVPDCREEENYVGVLVHIGVLCGHTVFGMGRSELKNILQHRRNFVRL